MTSHQYRHIMMSAVLAAFACIFYIAPVISDDSTGQMTEQTEFRLMVFGDSLVAGYGLDQNDSFPAQLEARLQATGASVQVLNAGVSGDTTAGGLARLDWALADRPDAVMVVLGGNDMLRGLEPSASRDNLDQILNRLTKLDIPVLLCGMLAPANLGADYQAEFDSLYPHLAQKYSQSHDVLFYPFFLEGVALDPALNQPDGLHPNKQGVAHIISSMTPLVRQLLNKAG